MARAEKNAPAIRRGPAHEVEIWAIERIKRDARNTRKHDEGQIDAIRASIREFGVTFPALVREDGTLIAGEGRWTAARLEGLAEFPVVVARGWTDEQCRAYSIADNRLTDLSDFDADLLRVELSELRDAGFALDLTGFSGGDLERALAGALDVVPGYQPGKGSLSDRFGVPPFSVLNAREGWWQNRKRAWLALGIQSELGRGEAANDRAISATAQGNDAAEARARYGAGRRANAIPGGAAMRGVDPATGKIVRKDMGAEASARARRATATPGGSAMPSANYSKTKARGDGRGRAVPNG